VIYPGKLTVAPTFRIGCIGHLAKGDIEAALAAIAEVLKEMGVTQCGHAASAAE
jgi:2-aminoethylphosphonate-pyruvate transaminase